MSDLQPIEHNGQRVLTTTQLAESYGTDTRRISENFVRNAERYTLGKHFFALEGEVKRDFINRTQIADGSKNASVLYLWTKKGAWLHAKSLNTDEAWEAYEALVDDYYRILEQQKPMMLEDLIIMQAQSVKELKAQVMALTEKAERSDEVVNVIQETFLQRDEDWRKSINSMLNGSAFRMGGNYRDLRNKSYEILEERAHCDLDKRLRNLLDRLEKSGATKTQLKNASRMDVIESDPRLKEIFSTVVKELSIGSMKVAVGR